MLLLGRDYLREYALPCATVEEVIAATGASRSRAYELREVVREALPSLLRPVGRPPAPPREVDPDAAYALRGAVLTFLMNHAGCVYGGATRRRYDDTFRRFVVELRQQHAGVDLERFADAIMVPLGTVKAWLTGGALPSAAPPASAEEDAPSDGAPSDGASSDGTPSDGTPSDGTPSDGTPSGGAPDDDASAWSAQAQTVISGWKTWHGSFGDYCDHLRDERRIPFGRSLIRQILHAHGQRTPRRRRGRSPDESALRGAFQTFFGGAQWVGDGSPIVVTLGGQPFCFNLELMVDAHSGGFVGMSVRDTEDSDSVIEAFHDGMDNTGGEMPLALLLDNKPSNHAPAVDAELSDMTLRIRATLFRPQNKAHVEGGFGLFQRSIPALDIFAETPRELAKRVLELVAQTWARTLNHRPRRDRGGRSRFDLYHDDYTAEQIDQARAALEERCRKQERARATLRARQNPVTRAILDNAFARLGFLDPEQHIRLAIARYSIDAVVEGIAIFNVKRRMGTLPVGVDGRYLLGIVRNIDEEREGVAVAEELLRLRLEARDRMLAPLRDARDAAGDRIPDLRERVLAFVDLALDAERSVDRTFWLHAAADQLLAHENDAAANIVQAVARRIHATHRVSYRERCGAVRVILDKVTPLSCVA